MTYKIWTSNGESHPEFTNYRWALDYMRKHVLASPRVYASGWFTIDHGVDELNRLEGYARCCYASASACRRDQDGGSAPKIERF